MSEKANIWGPHYWFVIHSIAIHYPTHPNKVTKKKYYNFIQDLPLFLPDETIGNQFASLLDKYPVSPYLDSRESFIRWTNFIHNKVNSQLGKKEKKLGDFLNEYYDMFKPRELKLRETWKKQEKYVYVGTVLLVCLGIFYLYKK
jgi:hypothetical protein